MTTQNVVFQSRSPSSKPPPTANAVPNWAFKRRNVPIYIPTHTNMAVLPVGFFLGSIVVWSFCDVVETCATVGCRAEVKVRM
jgi:hypothetical protein